jgi:hypothetical protein
VTSLAIRAHTDGTAARMSVAIDGQNVVTKSVGAKSWYSYQFLWAMYAGRHEIEITFLNPESRNLFLDAITFTGAAVVPPSTGETILKAYLTGYGYPDNDPANSDAIAWPTAARPHAGGTGTYADPISMAVGFTGSGTPDLPKGTLFYVPTLRRYFRIEDLCGACHGSPRPAGTAIWLDCWVGGQGKTAAYVDAIAASLTGAHAVIKNPAPDYVVAPGELADGPSDPRDPLRGDPRQGVAR